MHARRRRGSIDFDLPEAEVLMDDAGLIEDIVVAERNVAHRIIEEFMLLANETVADYLDSEGGPGLYRGARRARSGESRAVRRVHRRVWVYRLARR